MLIQHLSRYFSQAIWIFTHITEALAWHASQYNHVPLLVLQFRPPDEANKVRKLNIYDAFSTLTRCTTIFPKNTCKKKAINYSSNDVSMPNWAKGWITWKLKPMIQTKIRSITVMLKMATFINLMWGKNLILINVMKKRCII